MLMQPAHVHPSEPIVAKNMDISSVHLRPLTNELGGRRVRSPTVLLPPCFMTLHEQGFHSLPILAEVQCAITCPPRDIDCSVQVGMGLQTTDHTTKGLLIRTIGPVGIKIWHACDE